MKFDSDGKLFFTWVIIINRGDEYFSKNLILSIFNYAVKWSSRAPCHPLYGLLSHETVTNIFADWTAFHCEKKTFEHKNPMEEK